MEYCTIEHLKISRVHPRLFDNTQPVIVIIVVSLHKNQRTPRGGRQFLEMSIPGYRRFQFFNKYSKDISAILKDDSYLTCMTGGNGSLYFGDSKGCIHTAPRAVCLGLIYDIAFK